MPVMVPVLVAHIIENFGKVKFQLSARYWILAKL